MADHPNSPVPFLGWSQAADNFRTIAGRNAPTKTSVLLLGPVGVGKNTMAKAWIKAWMASSQKEKSPQFVDLDPDPHKEEIRDPCLAISTRSLPGDLHCRHLGTGKSSPFESAEECLPFEVASRFPLRLYMPPLDERPFDVFPLLDYFNKVLVFKEYGRRFEAVSTRLLSELLKAKWPANCRELFQYLTACANCSSIDDRILEMNLDPPLAKSEEMQEQERALAAYQEYQRYFRHRREVERIDEPPSSTIGTPPQSNLVLRNYWGSRVSIPFDQLADVAFRILHWSFHTFARKSLHARNMVVRDLEQLKARHDQRASDHQHVLADTRELARAQPEFDEQIETCLDMDAPDLQTFRRLPLIPYMTDLWLKWMGLSQSDYPPSDPLVIKPDVEKEGHLGATLLSLQSGLAITPEMVANLPELQARENVHVGPEMVASPGAVSDVQISCGQNDYVLNAGGRTVVVLLDLVGPPP